VTAGSAVQQQPAGCHRVAGHSNRKIRGSARDKARARTHCLSAIKQRSQSRISLKYRIIHGPGPSTPVKILRGPDPRTPRWNAPMIYTPAISVSKPKFCSRFWSRRFGLVQQCLFQTSFRRGSHPKKSPYDPPTVVKLCALNLYFWRDNELHVQIYHGNFLLMDNKRRKLFVIKHSKGWKSMPKIHQSAFGGRALHPLTPHIMPSYTHKMASAL